VRRIVLEEDLIFAALPTVNAASLETEGEQRHWYWRRLPAPANPEAPGSESSATFVTEIDPEPRHRLPSRLAVHFVGPVVSGIEQKVVINVNGKDLEPLTWSTPLEKRVEVLLPPLMLQRKTIIQIRNLSSTHSYSEPGNELGGGLRNALFVDRLEIFVPTLLLGPGLSDGQSIYRLQPPFGSARTFTFTALAREGQVIFDSNRQAFAPNGIVEAADSGETVVITAGRNGLKRPHLLTPLRTTEVHLAGPGADWVVVTVSRLKPELEPLVAHRRSQGLEPLVMEARELYDTFTHGRFDPAAVDAFMRAAHANWKRKPRYLLLVGDADHGADWISTQETLPTHMVITAYNGATATDFPFGDVDGNGTAEVQVGRIPVRGRLELIGVMNRMMDLERRPPPGAWRRKIAFVAGEARFSPMVDKVLENTFRRVVATEIPASYEVSLTWANPTSPYFWPAPQFGSHVVKTFNEGALAMAYVGHGAPAAFDFIRDPTGGRSRYPILDLGALESIDAGDKNPILAIIACWTGRFDHPTQDCIGELLLRRRGGPCAVIASSRISHPYPNALLGVGLSRGFFSERRPMGDMLQAARTIMMAESRGTMSLLARPFLSSAVDPARLIRDHLYLYNLLGDPAFRPPFADRDLAITAPSEGRPGEPLEITVDCGGGGGRLFVSLDRPVNRIASGLQHPSGDDPATEAAVVENHRIANHTAFVETQIAATAGPVRVRLDLPESLPPGPYVIKAYLVGTDTDTGDALGSQGITVPKE
jgi:hypothetical protein